MPGCDVWTVRDFFTLSYQYSHVGDTDWEQLYYWEEDWFSIFTNLTNHNEHVQ